MGSAQLLLTLLLVSSLTEYISCADPSYTLLVPKQAHTGRPLTSLLTVYYSSPDDVLIHFYKESDLKTSLLSLTKPVTGNGGLTPLEVTIPAEWTAGDYKMVLANNVFKTNASFKVKTVPYAILIQTDKPIYKPSQTINIRVAIIDDNLLPRNETVDVLIEDAEGNKLQQWLDAKTEMGLKEFSLALSDRPPLGDWKITVSTDVVDVEKTVKIDEYVLPRFEVNVELPSYILKGTDSITAVVTAKYTFGEDVVGTFSIVFESSEGTLRKTNLSIKGRATVTLDLDDIQKIGLRNGLLTAKARVYEPVSNKTLSGEGSTEIAASNYKITFMDINSKSYRPSQAYTAYYEVAKPDGARITGEKNKLQVTVQFAGSKEPNSIALADVPDTGIVAVTVSMPSAEAWGVSITSKLVLENGEEEEGPESTDLTMFQTVNTEDNIYLQISSTIVSVPEVGNVEEVTVETSGRNEKYFYVVMSRGRVVMSNSGTLSSGTSTFSLSITQEFTPQAYIVVYAVLQGELLADSFSFNVEGSFVNEVTLEFEDSTGTVISQAKPGDDVKVKVETEAGSTVGLLSVDKSVLLLGGGNDITQAQVLTELMSLVETSSSCDDDDDDEDGGFVFFWFPIRRGKSTEDVIATSGMNVYTDAELRKCFSDNFYYEVMFADDSDSAPQPPSFPEVSSGSVAAPKKRTLFPETWLWSIARSNDGSLVMPKTVPDTITTWVATAISMHPTSGIAITKQSTDLTVKLPFFISPVLPYSAVKGEELELKILVNNFGDADDSCTVVIESSDQYEVKAGENDLYMTGEDLELKPMAVEQGTVTGASVWLNPKVVDTISISVSATCLSGASDAFVRQLLVKPGGYPLEECDSEFVQLSDGDADVALEFDTVVPVKYVAESKRVQVQVTGDVMGPSIEGLESLVRVPYGCGEQNMISFTPNIFVRQYLDNMNNLNLDIKTRTTDNMVSGYQRELTYKHSDGSFSAFGESDPSGSTWLTAFVMKCFRQAEGYIAISEKVLLNAEEWLLSQLSKRTPGMFNEPGRVIHTEMQGGSSGGITLTAFVVISFLEDLEGNDLSLQIASLPESIAYLESSLSKVESNPYQLAIITYALQLAQSNKADEFVAKLELLQNEVGGLVWWDLPSVIVEAGDSPSYKHYRSGPSSTEMTSYALLTYINKGDVEKAKKIAMWITKKRGSNGGFQSTQDTVLGLQALAAYAKLVVSDSTNLNVVFESDQSDEFSHSITADNAVITKKHSFKSSDGITKVTAKLSGIGSAIVTTCTGYNVMSKPVKPLTVVRTNVTTPSKNSSQTVLEACIVYEGEGESGMGIVQIGLPTGYSAVVEDVKAKSGDMARAEITDKGEVAVYWNSMTKDRSCCDVPMVRENLVKDVKDAYVVGAQYYSTESGSRAFYNPSTAVVVSGDGEETGSTAPSHAITVSLLVVMLVMHFIR